MHGLKRQFADDLRGVAVDIGIKYDTIVEPVRSDKRVTCAEITPRFVTKSNTQDPLPHHDQNRLARDVPIGLIAGLTFAQTQGRAIDTRAERHAAANFSVPEPLCPRGSAIAHRLENRQAELAF